MRPSAPGPTGGGAAGRASLGAGVVAIGAVVIVVDERGAVLGTAASWGCGVAASIGTDSIGAESIGAESIGAESIGAESIGAESIGDSGEVATGWLSGGGAATAVARPRTPKTCSVTVHMRSAHSRRLACSPARPPTPLPPLPPTPLPSAFALS